MKYWSVPPIWKDEPVCFLLGCGPSLVALNKFLPLCEYGKVIAINDAYRMCPKADVLYFHDDAWWQSNWFDAGMKFQGQYYVSINGITPGTHQLRNTGPTGLETDPTGLRHGSNSGYQAINLAFLFGVKKIVLIGYDLQTVAGQVHWRIRGDKREQLEAADKCMSTVMLPKFATLKAPLEKHGVTVLNASPDSALKVWPYVPLGTVLEARQQAKLTF